MKARRPQPERFRLIEQRGVNVQEDRHLAAMRDECALDGKAPRCGGQIFLNVRRLMG